MHTNDYPDEEILALSILGWILADQNRADRFLALTGLTPDSLRTGLSDSSVLRAILEFLAAYEPDFMAASRDLSFDPAILASMLKGYGL